jgi:pyridoxal 5'-phosphate synthase pdxT subunit
MAPLSEPVDEDPPLIGVLALQGDVEEHVALLEAMGVSVREVRLPAELSGLDGIVLPGGESTTLQLLIDAAGLHDELKAMIRSGAPVLGTCAGMILLARQVLDGRPDQWSFGAIDLVVRRNAFGRQAESFEADLELEGIEGGSMHAVFIRAPFVEQLGEGVEVLARIAGKDGQRRVVACRQGKVIVTAFHPELVGDPRIHSLLVEEARRTVGVR